MVAISFLVAFPLCSFGAVVRRKNQIFLGNSMQPEMVARTLSTVEDEWKAEAAVFAECNASVAGEGPSIVNCADAPSSFGKSCSTVVNAIIQGSEGDKDVASEYMRDVCSQNVISGWHQEQCHALSFAVQGSMTADSYANRNAFDSARLCSSFWLNFLEVEKKRLVEAAERERVLQEQLQKEAAEKERIMQEKLKAEAERRKVEEKKHAEIEAKAKAAEAAARLAEKQAEAQAVAQAAKQKKAEAETAEKEHQKAMANLPHVQVASPPVVAKKPAASLAPKKGDMTAALKDAASSLHAIKAAVSEPIPLAAAVTSRTVAAAPVNRTKTSAAAPTNQTAPVKA